MLSALLLALLILPGCQKEVMPNETLPAQPALSIGNVSYNSQHDVLIFNTFDDVRNLQSTLLQLSESYPMDQGNTAALLATLQDIQNYGYTQNNQGNGNKVNLNNFEQSLLASYPLSNDVLLGIIQLNNNLNNGLPTSFLSTVLTANIPFGHEVEQAVTNASMQNAAKQTILSADNNTMLVPSFAYNDFLAQFPNFNSLYEVERTKMANDLAAGMDPASQQFDNHFVEEEFMRLILNDKMEVYIEGRLLKLYRDCAWAVFLESLTGAYAKLNLLDGDGYATPPTTVNETNAGVPISTMENYIPTKYALVHPDVYDPVNNTAANYEQDFAPNCPEATFSFIADETLGRTYHFNRFDWSGYVGTDYYYYWNFGDGTGSFMDDPTHTYATDGAYEVKLTIFKEDCGCWDTYTLFINTIKMAPSGCSASFTWSSAGFSQTANFEIDANWNAGGGAITLVTWDFGDGNTSVETDLTTSHTYASLGPWDVWATVEFDNGCVAYTQPKSITFPFDDPCCDRDDDAEASIDPFGLGEHKLVIRDRAKGTPSGLGMRLQGHQTFYKKNWNDKFRQRFADHDISVSGTGNHINASNKCEGAFTLPWLSGTDPWGASCTIYKGIYNLDDYGIGGNGFGIQDNTIHFRHKVRYGDLNMAGWHNMMLGDC